jgi:hypothetical protein
LEKEIGQLRAELDRVNVEANMWANRAHHAEALLALAHRDVERTAADENANARDLARARSEARDLERENASLRRRLREGGR